MDDLLRLLAVVALIFINGFFVAAEFALVAVRPTLIQQWVAEGRPFAGLVLKAKENPNPFISAAQLGITMASLALGWIAEPTLAHLVRPLATSLLPEAGAALSAHAVAVVLAFALITFMHITFGEQVPKMLAIQRPAGAALATVGPTYAFGLVFRPFIALIAGTTDAALRALRLRAEGERALAHSEEELLLLFRQSRAAGVLEHDEEQLLSKVFTFVDLEARQTMIPRPEMVCIADTATYGQSLDLARASFYSRLPVYERDIDHIVGVLYVKDLIGVDERAQAGFSVRAAMREPLFLPETVPVRRLLAEFRRRGQRMAILIDEFGGTAGLVTVEDIVEELLGEMRDEFRAEEPDVQPQPDGSFLLNGMLRLDEINARFELHLEAEEVDTIGGLVVRHLGRLALVGDEVAVDDRRLRVEELDGRRVARVRLLAPAVGAEEERGEGDVAHAE